MINNSIGDDNTMREQDPKKIIIGELLAPSNLKAYQKILNTPLDEKKSEFIDNCLKLLLWEQKERKDFKNHPLSLDIGDRVKIVNCTNKTIEDCIGVITDMEFNESITLYLVEITLIQTWLPRALTLAMNSR